MLNFDALSEGSLGPPMTKPWSVLSHRTKISLNQRSVGRRPAQKNRRSISPEGSPWIYEKSHQAQPSSSSEQSHQATLGFLRKKNKKDINLTIYSHGSCWYMRIAGRVWLWLCERSKMGLTGFCWVCVCVFFFFFWWCIINKYEWSFEFGVMSYFSWC